MDNPGGGTCLGKWRGCADRRIKTHQATCVFPSLRPISTDFWWTFLHKYQGFWWLFACFSPFFTVLWWLLIVLTILNNFVTILDEFSINSCVQMEEYPPPVVDNKKIKIWWNSTMTRAADSLIPTNITFYLGYPHWVRGGNHSKNPVHLSEKCKKSRKFKKFKQNPKSSKKKQKKSQKPQWFKNPEKS